MKTHTPAEDNISTQVDAFLASVQDTARAACAERAQAIRNRLAPRLANGRRLLPLIAESQHQHAERVRAAWRLLGSPAIAGNPNLLAIRSQAELAAGTLSSLWRSAPIQISAALADTDRITGSETNLNDIEGRIAESLRDLQNVDQALADNVTRLKSAMKELLTEPAAAAVAQSIAPPSPKATPRQTHATVAAPSLRGGRHHG